MAARLDFLLQLPGVDVLRIACGGLFRRIERNRFIPRQCAVRGMLEEEVDAFVLHPPRDKVAIAFVELSAAVPAAIAAREFLSQRMAIDAQYLLDDVEHGLVLEDAKVAPARGQPQPGAQAGLAGVAAVVLALHAQAGDDSVDVAHCAALDLYFYGGALSNRALAKMLSLSISQSRLKGRLIFFRPRNSRKTTSSPNGLWIATRHVIVQTTLGGSSGAASFPLSRKRIMDKRSALRQSTRIGNTLSM